MRKDESLMDGEKYRGMRDEGRGIGGEKYRGMRERESRGMDGWMERGSVGRGDDSGVMPGQVVAGFMTGPAFDLPSPAQPPTQATVPTHPSSDSPGVVGSARVHSPVSQYTLYHTVIFIFFVFLSPSSSVVVFTRQTQ